MARTASTAPPRSSLHSPSERAAAPGRFLARRTRDDAPPTVRALHERLLAAALEPERGPARRSPLVALDGTPLVYSETTGGSAFRLLTEPGALHREAPSQVDVALQTLDALLGDLGSRAAANDLNHLVRSALPPTTERARALRGGVGLGLALAKRLELRVYLDLREGSARERWQRLADALAPFADEASAALFGDLLERSAPRSIPVGLAAVIADEALRGLRWYVGVELPALGDLSVLTGVPERRLAPFCSLLGPFPPQRVTAAFDLALVAGVLAGRLARVKVDACRIGVDATHEVTALADAYGLDPSPLVELLDDLGDCFGGSVIQHLGVGFRGDETEVTVYAQPAGLARC